MDGSVPLLNVLLAVHVLAVGVWLGGLIALTLAVRSVRRLDPDGAENVSLLIPLIQRLNRVLWATLAIAIAAGAGLFAVLGPLGSRGFSSELGQLFVAKFAVVAILVVATAIHSSYVGPRVRRLREEGGSSQVVRRWSRLSGALAAVILIATLTAVLIALVIANR